MTVFEVGMTVCHWRAGRRVALRRIVVVHDDYVATDNGVRWTPDGRSVDGKILPASEADIEVIEQERCARRVAAMLTWLSTNTSRLPRQRISDVERIVLVAAREAIGVRYAGYAEATRKRLVEEQIESLLNLAATAEAGE